MFPDDSGAFQIVFGAFRSCESPEMSDLFPKISPTKIVRGQKMICWANYYLLLRKKPCFFLNFEKRVEERDYSREKGKVVVDGGIEMTRKAEI